MVLSRDPLCANVYVDYFPSRDNAVSILTHFHSDHMTNLRKHHENPIFCSAITAKLLRHRYRCHNVTSQPLDTPFSIGDVCVVFVDANHCPGSIVCICVYKKEVFVNTGDIRWYPSLGQSILKYVADPLRELHLDLSWANEAFTSFPSKHEAIQHTLDVLRNDTHVDGAVWLHSHGLGDEELISAVIAHFPTEHFTFLDKKRYHELQILGNVLTPDCSLCMPANREELVSLLRQKRRFFVIKNGRQRRGLPGVEISCSTLWWACRQHSKINDASVLQDPRTRVWHVLWAMHSSLGELQDLVRELRPKVLRPICDVILHADSPTNPLDRFKHLLATQSCSGSPLPISDSALAQLVPVTPEKLPKSPPKCATLSLFLDSDLQSQSPAPCSADVVPAQGQVEQTGAGVSAKGTKVCDVFSTESSTEESGDSDCPCCDDPCPHAKVSPSKVGNAHASQGRGQEDFQQGSIADFRHGGTPWRTSPSVRPPHDVRRSQRLCFRGHSTASFRGRTDAVRTVSRNGGSLAPDIVPAGVGALPQSVEAKPDSAHGICPGYNHCARSIAPTASQVNRGTSERFGSDLEPVGVLVASTHVPACSSSCSAGCKPVILGLSARDCECPEDFGWVRNTGSGADRRGTITNPIDLSADSDPVGAADTPSGDCARPLSPMAACAHPLSPTVESGTLVRALGSESRPGTGATPLDVNTCAVASSALHHDVAPTEPQKKHTEILIAPGTASSNPDHTDITHKNVELNLTREPEGVALERCVVRKQRKPFKPPQLFSSQSSPSATPPNASQPPCDAASPPRDGVIQISSQDSALPPVSEKDINYFASYASYSLPAFSHTPMQSPALPSGGPSNPDAIDSPQFPDSTAGSAPRLTIDLSTQLPETGTYPTPEASSISQFRSQPDIAASSPNGLRRGTRPLPARPQPKRGDNPPSPALSARKLSRRNIPNPAYRCHSEVQCSLRKKLRTEETAHVIDIMSDSQGN